MRPAIWLLTVAVLAAAEKSDEPWVEEEELDELYNDYKEEHRDAHSEDALEHHRSRREVHVDGPFEEHVRFKRRCNDGTRKRRSPDHVRTPRQVHQYEVHEVLEEESMPSPPYEEMLAASAEHYHKVYVAPGPRARYLNTEVNAGPLTFGVHPVADPGVVSAPINVASPLGPSNAQSNQPIVGQLSVPSDKPVAYAVLHQALEVGDDSSPAAGHHQQVHHPQAYGYSQSGGHQHQGKHQAEHGGKTVKASKTDHFVDKGGKGHKADEHHKKEYEEATGQKKKHHDHAGHKGSHEEQAHGHRGARFDEKKGHKKGHKTKGFHNKYHKDEFHKEHKFYDDFHKSGEHHRFGKFNAKHASNESGKKKAHHINAGHDFLERGKKGFSNKGHVDADHKAHKGKHGHEEHHENHSQHGKKGGKEGGSHWAHAKKN